MTDDASRNAPTERVFRRQKEEKAKGSSLHPSSMDIVPDQLISDLLKRESETEKYVIGKKIAQGGMGAIYQVFDQDLKRTSVLKVIVPGAMQDALLFRRFIEEAQITGQLEHPNIIPVHELGVLETRKLYFSMKYVQGNALGSILRKIRADEDGYAEKYSQFSLLTIFRKVCDAVAYAHSKNIIHRDIKPDNIMVGNYGEVLLMDWGLARPTDRHQESMTASGSLRADDFHHFSGDGLKTRFGVIKGTPTYMSPEQAKGLVMDIDHRSDIFLLGATLYAMVTFQVPFTGNDIYEILANAEEGEFVKPAVRAPERQIPDELCRIIEKAMEYDREDRYQSVEELSSDLDALLSGNAVSVRKKFITGEFLMQEGEPGYEAYVILSGKVEVTKTINGKKLSLITLNEGDIIGEMALILQAPRSASVQAIEATEVVIINEDTMKQGLGHLPPWMGKVVDSLADRLRKANQNVHPLVKSDCTFHVLNQIRLLYCFWGDHMVSEVESPIMKTETMIHDIVVTLSLEKERVASIVSKLFDFKLLQNHQSEHLRIPDVDLFNDFVFHIQEQLKINAKFRGNFSTSFQLENGHVVMKHINKKKPPKGDLPKNKKKLFSNWLNELHKGSLSNYD